MPIPLIPGAPPFQSGVGGGTDLKVQIREDLQGGWYPRLKRGHYFLAEVERYLFAQKGYTSFVEATLLQPRTATVTGLAADPTAGGPVLMRRESDGRLLQRVSSPLAAFVRIEPSDWTTVSGDLKVYVVPGLVVQLCADPKDQVYLQVPAVEDILSTEDYVYDAGQGKLWIRDSAPPELYVTCVRGSAQTTPLQQEEIVLISPDGKVRTQLSGVFSAAGYEPTLYKPTPSGPVQVTAVVEGKNVLVHASPDLQPGDIVRVCYYAKETFNAQYSGGTLTLRYLVSQSDTYFVEYELGGEHFDTSTLPAGDDRKLQLNPLLAPRESGYLYLLPADDGYPEVTQVRVDVDNWNPLFDAGGCPPFMVLLTALDSEGEPIPGVELHPFFSGPACRVTLAHGEDGTTNGLGQAVYRVTPLAAGVLTITGKAGPVAGPWTVEHAVSLRVRDRSDFTDPDEHRLGKLLAHLEPTPYEEQRHRFSAYHCFPDGAPFQANGATEVGHSSITFSSEKGTLYAADYSVRGPRLTLPADADSVASVLVEPVPGDVLRAEVAVVDASGNRRVRRAKPIRIPTQPDTQGQNPGADHD